MLLKLEVIDQEYNMDKPAERAKITKDLESLGFFDIGSYDRHKSTLASGAPGRDKVIDFLKDVRLFSQAIYRNRRVH